MIRPTIQTFFAAMLTAASLFLLIFGPEGVLIFAYHLFPLEQRMWLFGAYPPDQASIDLGLQALLALALLVAGANQFVQVWAAYPEWRKALVWSTGAAVAWVVWAFSQIRVF